MIVGFDDEQDAVVKAYPRGAHFKENIIRAFYDGVKHKPETMFGNVKADVIADRYYRSLDDDHW